VPAVGRAGWFDAGPRPGEPGRSVIIGHFDASNGPGLFALLPAVANGTDVVVRDGRGALGSGPAGVSEQSRPAQPAWLSIPAVSIEAPVDPVSGTATGIEVPAVGRAGWFDAGPRPGEPGRSVIIGHFDASNGPGLFALLPAVANGTDVVVRDRAGATHRFEIVGKAEMEKSKFPSGAVYGSADRPVLVLVTCGGPYTPRVGYRDNVLIYARAA